MRSYNISFMHSNLIYLFLKLIDPSEHINRPIFHAIYCVERYNKTCDNGL